jgi:hypothetical protein
MALPTTSISESPGIQSSAMEDRDGALPGLKYVPYYFIQCLIVGLIGVETRLAGQSCSQDVEES